MTSSRSSSRSGRRFMFIEQDADRGTSSEAIRVHVMRESHRARRQLRGLMQPTENHGQMTILSSGTPPLTRRHELSRETSREDSTEQSPSRATEGAARQQQPDLTSIPELKRLAQERLSSIRTATPTRIDTTTPSFVIFRDLSDNIVELCNDDAAALNALLALITSAEDSVSLLQAVQYESSALEALRLRLADTSSAEHSDETITAVLLLSRLEVSLPPFRNQHNPWLKRHSARARTKRRPASMKQHCCAWSKTGAASKR